MSVAYPGLQRGRYIQARYESVRVCVGGGGGGGGAVWPGSQWWVASGLIRKVGEERPYMGDLHYRNGII